MPSPEKPPVLRFAKVLAEKKDQLGSFVALAREIEKSSSPNYPGIDRRKLTRIVAGDDVSLSISELMALDSYLAPLGEGLAEKPLFEEPWLLSGLLEKDSVLMLLGSYPRSKDRRNDLSRWDVWAMAKLIRGIEKMRPTSRIHIDDVLNKEKTPVGELKESIMPLLTGRESVCCIGSPRACLAAELMLAEMFEVDPFVKPKTLSSPFYLIWSHQHCSYESALAFKAEDLRTTNRKMALEIDKDSKRALKVGKTFYISGHREDEQEWKEYGVAVGQRRANGHVWLVVMGLSGPATYATAAAVGSQMTGTLPEPSKKGTNAPIRWALVEATVVDTGVGPGDTREVVNMRVLETFLFPFGA
jgi:hypothetical protein